MHGALSYDWNLYTQNYFGLWGRPEREDWKVTHVLTAVAKPSGGHVRLGISPNIPRFDPVAFEFYIALGSRPVTVNRLWHFDERAIRDNDFVLVSEPAGPGDAFSELLSPDVTRTAEYVALHPDKFRMLERFVLPNRIGIRLYEVSP